MIAIFFLKIWLCEVSFYNICSKDIINFSPKILNFTSSCTIFIHVELLDSTSVLSHAIISLIEFQLLLIYDWGKKSAYDKINYNFEWL